MGAEGKGEAGGGKGKGGRRSWLLRVLIAGVPVGIAAYFQFEGRKTLFSFNFAGCITASWVECLTYIRTAPTAESAGWYNMMPTTPEDWPFSFTWLGFKATLGLTWVHPLLKAQGPTAWLTRPSGAESSFCYDTLSYMWVNPTVSMFAYPSIYADREDVQEWIKACKVVWHQLSDQEKGILAPYRAAGQIPLELAIPFPDDNERIKRTARMATELPLYENSERLTREQLREILRGSIAQSEYDGTGQEPPEETLDYYAMMNMRKAVEIPADWAEIGGAIRAGRITKFDATALLPKELFNLSFATMGEWEGAAAKNIPVFADASMPASLAHFVRKKAEFMSVNPLKSRVTAADEQMSCVNGGPNRLKRPERTVESHTPAGYIHTRRLPEFHKKLPNVERLTGIEGDVLRGQSMLWLGATNGGFHYDEEANVYVQLSGHSTAMLVPQNWTDYFTGAVRHPWSSAGLPGTDEVAKDPLLKNVPVYLIPLKPGDGVTLHSRTYHRFMAQTYDRISLNWFFIPGWRKMEYNPADWYSLEAKNSLPRLALRQLWARTLSKVFDDTGRGVVYMGTKLEYL